MIDKENAEGALGHRISGASHGCAACHMQRDLTANAAADASEPPSSDWITHLSVVDLL
jgi:hypothetical protein